MDGVKKNKKSAFQVGSAHAGDLAVQMTRFSYEDDEDTSEDTWGAASETSSVSSAGKHALLEEVQMIIIILIMSFYDEIDNLKTRVLFTLVCLDELCCFSKTKSILDEILYPDWPGMMADFSALIFQDNAISITPCLLKSNEEHTSIRNNETHQIL